MRREWESYRQTSGRMNGLHMCFLSHHIILPTNMVKEYIYIVKFNPSPNKSFSSLLTAHFRHNVIVVNVVVLINSLYSLFVLTKSEERLFVIEPDAVLADDDDDDANIVRNSSFLYKFLSQLLVHKNTEWLRCC